MSVTTAIKDQTQQEAHSTQGVAAPRKLIKRLLTGSVAASGLVLASLGQAATYDQAKVLDVNPIYQTVNVRVPVEACWEEEVPLHRQHPRSATAPIVGAIIGGAIGNAVGNGKRNRQVGTVVGAVLGGSIGADIARHGRHRSHGEYTTRQVWYSVRDAN